MYGGLSQVLTRAKLVGISSYLLYASIRKKNSRVEVLYANNRAHSLGICILKTIVTLWYVTVVI